MSREDDDETLVADGKAARRNQILHRPNHAPVLNAGDEKLWQEIEAILDTDPLRPPVVHEIARNLGATPDTVAGVLRRAERLGAALTTVTEGADALVITTWA